MRQSLKRLDDAVKAANIGAALPYGMTDAIALYSTLGLFERAGIAVAALDMTDRLNPKPVRFDANPKDSAAKQLLQCVRDGRVYLAFDQYELVALIAKTTQQKLFSQRVRYTPFFLTPHAPVITGPSSAEYEQALVWVEACQRRAEEITPTLLAGA